MASVFFYISIFLLFSNKCLAEEDDLKCTMDFCDEYIQRYPCPKLDPACSNSSRAIILPSASTCNCCEHCFLFLDEGQDCIVGGPGQPLPDVMCKPGTECVKGICVKKNVPDPDFYPGYECKDGKCFCTVLENNQPQKIFGEFKETDKIKKEKQCECSITAYKAKKIMKLLLPNKEISPNVPRCLPNGQFDPLQCFNEMCGCVDKATGAWDSSVRKVVIQALSPGNPKCFDESRHRVGEYYTTCEKERNDIINDKFWADIEGEELLLSRKVECTPDGEYVQ